VIHEWKPEHGDRNFGDALYIKIFDSEFLSWAENNEDFVFFLIGSLICDDFIEYATWVGKKPIFVHCGLNGKKLSSEEVSRSNFIGSRGKLTASLLSSLGKETSGLGDPIYGLIGRIEYTERREVVYFVPHISEIAIEVDFNQLGCDEFLSPAIREQHELDLIIEKIGSAQFVLTGSMHVAMLAHITETPFALYVNGQTRYIDHEVKWIDWLSIFDVAEEEIVFVENVAEGTLWYEKLQEKLKTGLTRVKVDVSSIEIQTLVEVNRIYASQRDEALTQRDEALTQRDEALTQRDEALTQRDEILNSQMWRATKLFRWIFDAVKALHKK
jgi:hypothetical protein